MNKDSPNYDEWKEKMRLHNIELGQNRKGKTLEEIHGIEKAKIIREKMRMPKKDFEYKRQMIERCHKENKFRKGKTYEEIYGTEKAQEIRLKKKGKLAWNKGKKGCFSEETIKQMIKSRTGWKYPIDQYPNHGMRGKTMPLEGKQKMSASISGSNHPMFGKKHTSLSISKMKKSHEGVIPWNKGLKGVSTSWAKGLSGKEWLKYYPNGHPRGMLGKTQTDEWKIQKAISMSGENNHNYGKTGEKSLLWQGGKTFEPYTPDFTNKFKLAIKARDNHSCVMCNLFEEDAIKLYKKNLNIHHIDYNKKNTFFQNCVSLCVKCHGMTNFNRDHWKTFFQSLLKERYGYEYTQDQKIILDFMKNEKW